MDRLRRIFCSKRAFTLVETIVASAVSTIVLIAVLGFMITTSANMKTTKELNSAILASEMIFDELEDELRFASSVAIKSVGDIKPSNPSVAPPIPPAATVAKGVVVYLAENPAVGKKKAFNLLHIKANGSTTGTAVIAPDMYEKIRCTVTFTPANPSGGLIVTIKAHQFSRPEEILIETKRVIKLYSGTATLDAGLTEGNYIVATMPS